MPLHPGDQLGPYEIRAQIGAGGMGDVYSAFDTRLRRSVAIKIVRDHLTSGERARLEREAQAIAALSHPNIVSVFDVGNEKGLFFVVTELLQGQTLRDELSRGAVPGPTAIRYARDVALALHSAHAKGIVHRDIKPENLFITADGRMKILDFGLARLVATDEGVTAVQEPQLTGADVVLGTIGYMSPEQVRGEAVDARSDIFALGCVLFEMLTGRPPFRRSSAMATTAAILNDAPDLTALPPLPRNVLRALQCSLEKDAGDRFLSADALAAALDANPPPQPKPRRRMIAAAAALLLVAGAVIGLYAARRHEPLSSVVRASASRRAMIAVLPFETLGGDASQEYFSDGLTEDTTTEFGRVSPDHLGVIARTSTMRYKNSHSDVRTIGHDLGVDYVVEGSVRRSGGRIRVAAQLVRASDGTEIWADTYDRTVNDALTVQSELARDVARAVEINVMPSRATPPQKAAPRDPAARDAFLRGRYHLLRGTPGDARKAIEYLQQALEIEPDSPVIMTTLAEALDETATMEDAPRNVIPRERALIERALQIDDSMAEPHAVLGQMLLEFYWDFGGAERELKKAISLDPNLARACTAYATLLICEKRYAEGMQYTERARTLDPVGAVQRRDSLWALAAARRWNEMIDQAQKALDITPDFGYAYAIIGLARIEQGQRDAALAAAGKVEAMTKSRFSRSIAAYVKAKAGQRGEALRMVHAIEEESKHAWVCFFNVASVYAALGDKDRAFASLERAFADRSG